LIEIKNITKTFEDVRSLDSVSAVFEEGSLFGLIGSNGSGKSTLLRVMCGVYSPDMGEVIYDGEAVWENSTVKERVVCLSDEPYFSAGTTLAELRSLYSSAYPNFCNETYKKLLDLFGLDQRKKINTFSKGMQKQASLLLGLSCRPRYLFCDETFDGLDPVMRALVKRLLAQEVAEGVTVIIASHNLRELEDICDHVGMLHHGELLFVRDVDEMKTGITKIQAAFDGEMDATAFAGLDIISLKQQGRLYTLIARGDEVSVTDTVRHLDPAFIEVIPLTLEEIFITEMEERGYDYSEVIL